MFCRKCGTKIKEDAQFCPRCGAETKKADGFHTDKNPPGTKKAKTGFGNHGRKKRRRKAALGILAAVTFLLGMFAAWKDFGHSFNADDTKTDITDSLCTAAVLPQTRVTDEKSAAEAAKEAGLSMGFENAMEEMSAIKTTVVDGQTFYRLAQYYKGIRVYGRYAIVVAKEDGAVLEVSADVTDIPSDLDLKASAADEDILTSVKAYAAQNWGVVYDDIAITPIQEAEPVIYTLKNDTYRLAYCLTVTNGGQYEVTAAADTGEVLSAVAAARDVAAVGSVSDGSLSFPVEYDEANGSYAMEDTAKNISVYYADGASSKQEGFYASAQSVVSDKDAVFGNNSQETAKKYDLAARYYSIVENIAEYYSDRFNESTPNNGLLIVYDDSRDNGKQATGGRAALAEGGYVSVLTIGSQIPADSYEILAHEYTHCIQYSYEAALEGDDSQAIKEGLSDLFGIFAEACCKNTEPDWDMDLSAVGGTHRNAADPGKYFYPSSVDDWALLCTESGGHKYATAVTHAAWLMYQSQAFSLEQLERLWYKAMIRLPYTCSFEQLAACLELEGINAYGEGSLQVSAIQEALYATGLAKESSDKCTNTISLSVAGRSQDLYDDYSVDIEGDTAGIVFGLGSEHISKHYDSSQSKTINMKLSSGTYTAVLTDNANAKETQSMTLQVESGWAFWKQTDLSVMTDFGAEYTVSPGADLTVLASDGSEISSENYTAAAQNSRTGAWADVNTETLDLDECNYYILTLSQQDSQQACTYYTILTVRIQDGGQDSLEIETDFLPDSEIPKDASQTQTKKKTAESGLPSETGDLAEEKDAQAQQAEEKKVKAAYLEELPILESGQYTGNQGDSFVYTLGKHKNTRGSTDIDGNRYDHGIEVWLGRWNYAAEKSWAWSTYDLDGQYRTLTGECVLIGSYNTTDFDTTLEFWGDGTLIASYHLTPDSIPFAINLDVTGVKELKIYACDTVEKKGGTSFGLTGMVLDADTTNDQTNQSAAIPADAQTFSGHSYKFFTVDSITSWQQAQSYCQELGGYLAIISSDEENHFLYQMMTKQGYDSAYFGISDSITEGIWLNADGSQPVYTNWHSGEPNSENPNEDYGMFYWKYTDETWNDGDFGGDTVNGGATFICEWDRAQN